jgi:hypothetical protein
MLFFFIAVAIAIVASVKATVREPTGEFHPRDNARLGNGELGCHTAASGQSVVRGQ